MLADVVATLQRSAKLCANIASLVPGRARQSSWGTAGTYFTKLWAQTLADLTFWHRMESRVCGREHELGGSFPGFAFNEPIEIQVREHESYQMSKSRFTRGMHLAIR